jgi:ketosteroid isomerase-like protein
MTVSPDWERRLRDAIAAFNRGEYDAVLGLASDDIELQRASASPDSREVVRGREQVVEYLRPNIFSDQRIEILNLEIGDDTALVRTRFSARGSGSGIPVDVESWTVYRVEGEALTRIEIYNDEAEARAAAGL